MICFRPIINFLLILGTLLDTKLHSALDGAIFNTTLSGELDDAFLPPPSILNIINEGKLIFLIFINLTNYYLL